jgi:hypothetical protein
MDGSRGQTASKTPRRPGVTGAEKAAGLWGETSNGLGMGGAISGGRAKEKADSPAGGG